GPLWRWAGSWLATACPLADRRSVRRLGPTSDPAQAGMSDHSRIDFWTFLFILRQRWALIVGCGLVAAVLAFGLSLVMPERYKASADLLFEKSNLDAAVLGSDTGAEAQTAPERVAATNLELASLQVVAENTRQRLGTSLTVRQLQDRISIKPKGRSEE